MNDDFASRFAACSTPDLADALRRQGVSRAAMQGLGALTPVGGSVAGRARTLRNLPDREDVKQGPNGAVNRRLYDSFSAGDVLVVDGLGSTSKAALGDMMFTRLIQRGAAAVVIDGAARDIPVMQDKGMPIFARASCPEPFFGSFRPWDADVDIQCGGVLVRPGDWIVADAEGIVVVPAAMAAAVLADTEAKRGEDAFSAALLGAGFTLDESYPLPEFMRQFRARFDSTGKLPTQAEIDVARPAK